MELASGTVSVNETKNCIFMRKWPLFYTVRSPFVFFFHFLRKNKYNNIKSILYKNIYYANE